MEAKQIAVHAIAQPPNSEGLLALPALQKVKGQTCFILCGQDPRPLLPNTLRARGAKVVMLHSYRRVAPVWDSALQLKRLQQHAIHVVVITSVACANNLVEGLGPLGRAWLRTCSAVVPSGRVAQECQKAQWFAMIYVAQDASDASMLSALQQCANEQC